MLKGTLFNEKILTVLSLQTLLLYLIYKFIPEALIYAVLLAFMVDLLVSVGIVSWKHVLALIVLGALVSAVRINYLQLIVIFNTILFSTLIYYNTTFSILSTLAFFTMLSYRIYGLGVFTLKTYVTLNLYEILGFDEVLVFSLGMLIPLIRVFTEKALKHSLVCFIFSILVVSALYLVSLVNVYTLHISIIGFSSSILILSIAKFEE